MSKEKKDAEVVGNTQVTEQRKRRTDEEVELVRRQIFELRNRGLSYSAIGKVTGLTLHNVVYHLEQMKKKRFNDLIRDANEQLLIGDVLLKMDRLEQMALANYSTTDDAASAAKLHWLECASRRLDDKVKFLDKIGFIENLAEKDKKRKKKLKRMSNEEIQQRAQEIRNALAREQEQSLDLIDENKKLKKILEQAGIVYEEK